MKTRNTDDDDDDGHDDHDTGGVTVLPLAVDETAILLRPHLPFTRCVNSDGKRAPAKRESRQRLGAAPQG